MAQAVQSPPTITVLGSLNIDLVFRVPHHPLPGETLTASSFSVHCGGKGANQAVACAKLTRPRPRNDDEGSASSAAAGAAAAVVRMVGAVGDDGYGRMLVQNLQRFGVDCGGVKVLPSAEVATGMANIIVDEPTGQNRIVLSPGANAKVLGDAFLDLALPPSEPLPALLILQLEIPLETAVAAIQRARERGVPVLFNPAPALADLPPSIFQGLAHLVLNETEAAILAGCDVQELDTLAGLERIAEEFVRRGVQTVVMTLGGRGAYYLQAAAEGKKRRADLVPAEKVNVVDTTGAGDTWVGQYAAEVVAAARSGSEFDIDAAVRRAGRAAAKAVQVRGAQDSIPWMDEL